MWKIFVISVLGVFALLHGSEISGQGFLKTKGGNVKTCAGNKVYLNSSPNSKYYVYAYAIYYEKIRQNNLKNLSRPSAEMKRLISELDNIPKDEYYETICDAQGNFKFKNIEKGNYTIGTTIDWLVRDEMQGGFIIKSITINENENIVLITE